MDTGYLSQQVTTIINQLHGYFDEIGIPSHERDQRESELFSALSETLHNQLKLVASEKHERTEEARQLIRTIRQMEASLDDSKSKDDYDREDDELKVTYPLLSCIENLRHKHKTISRLHRERYEQVKQLAEALHSYASHLEPAFLSIKLPPLSQDAKLSPTFDISPSYLTKLDQEFTRVYDEYNRRVALVQSLAEEIVMLWGELGTPQAQVDSNIVKNYRETPEQLGLHQDDLQKIKSKREKLMDEKRQREKRLKELRSTVEQLWEKLNIDQAERKAFMAANRGCGMRTINEYEDELSKLEEMKRQNLHIFVEDARFKLQELWDNLYFSEEEMLEFTPAFSDVYSDALLSAHEAEINRLEVLKQQRAPMLLSVDRYRSLIKDRDDLAASSQDASRLLAKGAKGEKRDPTRLLREEKMRKRIAKDLPKVEAELRRVLEAWEEEYGRPFLVHGERYLDELEACAAPARAAPARTKTPSNLIPAANTKSVRTAPPASRNGTMHSIAPPRSKTPTASMARNPLASSVMGASVSNSTMKPPTAKASTMRGSPSKLPTSRQPLSNMTDGKNSPERRPRTAVGYRSAAEEQNLTLKTRMSPPKSTTLRGNPNRMGPPPPPKMKDFFPPTPTPTHYSTSSDHSSVIVRHMDPEDPYEETASSSYRSHPSGTTMGSVRIGTTHSSSSSRAAQHHNAAAAQYPMAPSASRNTSAHSSSAASHTSYESHTSAGTAATAATTSDNWETYGCDDGAEEESYYPPMPQQNQHQLRAQQQQQERQQQQRMEYARAPAKRLTPDGGYEGFEAEVKKMRGGHVGLGLGIKTGGPGGAAFVGGRANEREGTVEGSENNWTETDDGSVF